MNCAKSKVVSIFSTECTIGMGEGDLKWSAAMEEAKALRCQLLRGYIDHTLSTVTWAPDKCIFLSDDPVPSLWYSLLKQGVFSWPMRCRSILHYYTCMKSRYFPVKQITHVTIAKTYTLMRAREVNNENQMKSSFFRGNLSTRNGEVSYFIPL